MTHTILVVEDDPGVLGMVRAVLTRGGCGNVVDGEDCGAPPRLPDYEVLCAHSAEEGLRIASEFPRPIHLLLADVVMPGMLGTEVAAILKETRPGIRVILMSGKPDGQLAVLDTGWQFLQKPFVGAALLERVSAQLASGMQAGAGW